MKSKFSHRFNGVNYAAGETLPDALVEILRTGNPKALIQEARIPAPASAQPARIGGKGKAKKEVVPSGDASQYDDMDMSTLEEIALEADIDPDQFEDKKELINALIAHDAAKGKPVPSSAVGFDEN